MKAGNRKRETHVLFAATGVAAVLLLAAYANGELQEYEGIDSRSFLAEMHEKGKCRTCHGVTNPEGYREDGRCLRCHEVDLLVAATCQLTRKTAGRIRTTTCTTAWMCPASSAMASIRTRRRCVRTAITSTTRITSIERVG
jgi:hypothetical protein